MIAEDGFPLDRDVLPELQEGRIADREVDDVQAVGNDELPDVKGACEDVGIGKRGGFAPAAMVLRAVEYR